MILLDCGRDVRCAREAAKRRETEMCCRYYMEMSPALRPIVEAAGRSALYRNNMEKIARALKTSGEISPDSLVPVIASSRSGKKTVYPMLWGYHEEGIRHAIVNARSETAAEKRSFREGWAMHRCIIPASGYYEWQHLPAPDGKSEKKIKHAVMPKEGEITWLCGLYRMEDGYPHFVILTREAGESVAFLHDRMPVILPEDRADEWIDPNRNPHRLIEYAVTDMIAEKVS